MSHDNNVQKYFKFYTYKKIQSSKRKKKRLHKILFL